MAPRGLDRSLSGSHLDVVPGDVAEGFPGRWLGLVGSMWLLACSGNSYNFAIYSSTLKDMLGLTQEQLGTLAVGKDVGDNVGLLAGLLGDLLPAWAVICIGLVMSFGGYGLLGLMVVFDGYGASYWTVWVLLCVATNGASFFITAGLVTAQRNFPRSGGIVAGIVVGFIGLSGAIFAQLYNSFLAPDVGGFLLLLAVVPTVVAFACCFIVRPYPPPLWSEAKADEEHTNLRLLMRCCLALAAFLLLGICLQTALPQSQPASLFATSGMLLLLLLPAIFLLPTAFRHTTEGPPLPRAPSVEALAPIAEEDGTGSQCGDAFSEGPSLRGMTHRQAGHTLSPLGSERAKETGVGHQIDEGLQQPSDRGSEQLPPISTARASSHRASHDGANLSPVGPWESEGKGRGARGNMHQTATPPASPVDGARRSLNFSKLGRAMSFMAHGLGRSSEVAEVLNPGLLHSAERERGLRTTFTRARSLQTALEQKREREWHTASFSHRILKHRQTQSHPDLEGGGSGAHNGHAGEPLPQQQQQGKTLATEIHGGANGGVYGEIDGDQSVPDFSDAQGHFPEAGAEAEHGHHDGEGEHGRGVWGFYFKDEEGGHSRTHKSVLFTPRSDTESAPGSGHATPLGHECQSPLRQPLLDGLREKGDGGKEDSAPAVKRLGQDHTFGEALCTVDFWLLYLGLVFGYGCGLAAISNLAQIGESLGYTSNIQVFTSVLSVCQFLGRLASGSISELLTRKYGIPRPIFIACFQCMMIMGLLSFAFAIPGSLYIGSLLVGFTFGGLCSLMPVTAGELFGLQSLGMLYNMFLTAFPVGSYLLSGILVGNMYEWEASRFPSPPAPPNGTHAPTSTARLSRMFEISGQEGALAGLHGVRLSHEVKTCYGTHCFKLIFILLSIICVSGSLFHVVVAVRTRSLYAKMRVDDSEPEHLEERMPCDDLLEDKQQLIN